MTRGRRTEPVDHLCGGSLGVLLVEVNDGNLVRTRLDKRPGRHVSEPTGSTGDDLTIPSRRQRRQRQDTVTGELKVRPGGGGTRAGTHDDLALVTQAGERPLGVSAMALAGSLVADCEEARECQVSMGSSNNDEGELPWSGEGAPSDSGGTARYVRSGPRLVYLYRKNSSTDATGFSDCEHQTDKRSEESAPRRGRPGGASSLSAHLRKAQSSGAGRARSPFPSDAKFGKTDLYPVLVVLCLQLGALLLRQVRAANGPRRGERSEGGRRARRRDRPTQGRRSDRTSC